MRVEKNVPEIRFQGFSGSWEEKNFKDIIANLSGGASIAPDDYQSSGVRTIPKGAVSDTGVANLSGSKYVSIEFYEKNILSKATTGDLVTSLRDLVPTAPNMGRVVKIISPKEDFLMPQGVYKIELANGVDERFIISYSNSGKYRSIISREKTGSTQVHIRNGDFLNIEIAIPSSEEQSVIGGTFQKLDNLINQHQQKHDKLSNVKKAMLEKMFPKQGENIPEIRFKGFSGEWLERSLKEIASDITDGNWIEAEHIFDSGEYRIIQTGNIGVGQYLDRSKHAKYFHQSNFDAVRGNEIFPGDILISRLADPAGRAAILPTTGYRMVTAVDVAIVRPEPCFDSYFLMTLLNRDEALKAVREWVSGTSHKRISHANLVKVKAVVPCVEEQAAIGGYFQKLDELINQHQQQIIKLNNIKQACLSKMFV